MGYNRKQSLLFISFCLVIAFTLIPNYVSSETPEDDDDLIQIETVSEFEDSYSTPKKPAKAYLSEHFDSPEVLNKKWIKSKAKKPDVEEDIAQYVGQWSIEPSVRHPLRGDNGLVQKSKAKHHAISAHLDKTFVFNRVPFVVQYEVMFQEKHDCGGAYIKLLTEGPALKDLTTFNDKTPYTIMFGPDKCGTDDKVHFIIRHRNPLNGTISEKHHKPIRAPNTLNLYTNEGPHLYTLALYPDNKYAVYIDNELNVEGHLLDEGTFEPSINPPKEIVDVNDKKPQTWDEREKIPDPLAVKPDDWDENEPYEIEDLDAHKPDGWLEDEPKLIPDPTAIKPADWDDEIDGEWEAPQIENPLCSDAPGCGPWTIPMIKNPKFKGKWSAPLINNPNYNGKWSPRNIPNPDYYHDAAPFKLSSIGAVGIEIWTMSDNVYFDNILITESIEEAKQFADATFKLKQNKLNKDKETFVNSVIRYTNENPWLWAVYVIVVGLFVVLFYILCCQSSKDERDVRDSKKNDAPTMDDAVEPLLQEEEEEEEQAEDVEEEEVKKRGGRGGGEESATEDQTEEEEEDQEEEADEDEPEEEEEENETEEIPKKSNSASPKASGEASATTPSSPRKRRSRRE